MAKSVIHNLEVDGITVPIRIYKEWRSSTRISLGRKNAILRIPSMMGAVLYKSQIAWAQKWIEKQFKANPDLKKRFVPKIYKDGDEIAIYDKRYILKIGATTRRMNTGEVIEGDLVIKLSHTLRAEGEQAMIQKMVRRLVADDNLYRVTDRIHELNNIHFQEKIKSVKLKYNTSNWGSCSNSGNVNISTRLLCAPHDVQDYVYIHELSHLKELNHSPQYWAIVQRVMPEYRKHEEWLKVNGIHCNI